MRDVDGLVSGISILVRARLVLKLLDCASRVHGDEAKGVDSGAFMGAEQPYRLETFCKVHDLRLHSVHVTAKLLDCGVIQVEVKAYNLG